MKKINVTFSIPVETHQQLRSIVGQRKMSSFVVQAINKALEQQKGILKQAYVEAENDPDRKKTIQEWQDLDLGDWE